MVKLRGLDLGTVGALMFFGYIAFLLVSFTLSQLGIFSTDENLSLGLLLLAAGLGMYSGYVIVVKKNLSLSFPEIVTVLLVAGIIIATLVFIPDLAPQSVKAGLGQLQSIVGNGGG